MNPAELLLGPLYNLYVSALGNTIGMVLGYVTLLGFICIILWSLNNHKDLISAFNLKPNSVGNYVFLIVLTLVLYFVISDTLGFPFLGSITVAVSGVIFYNWTINSLEGETL